MTAIEAAKQRICNFVSCADEHYSRGNQLEGNRVLDLAYAEHEDSMWSAEQSEELLSFTESL